MQSGFNRRHAKGISVPIVFRYNQSVRKASALAGIKPQCSTRSGHAIEKGSCTSIESKVFKSFSESKYRLENLGFGLGHWLKF